MNKLGRMAVVISLFLLASTIIGKWNSYSNKKQLQANYAFNIDSLSNLTETYSQNEVRGEFPSGGLFVFRKKAGDFEIEPYKSVLDILPSNLKSFSKVAMLILVVDEKFICGSYSGRNTNPTGNCYKSNIYFIDPNKQGYVSKLEISGGLLSETVTGRKYQTEVDGPSVSPDQIIQAIKEALKR